MATAATRPPAEAEDLFRPSGSNYSLRMSRALRYAPPLASRGLIVRPRLLARLRTRFERPLTAVVAAAGFGKTTLLGQAVQENALSPLGEDRWLTCQRDDTALSFLAAGRLRRSRGLRPVPEDPRGRGGRGGRGDVERRAAARRAGPRRRAPGRLRTAGAAVPRAAGRGAAAQRAPGARLAATPAAVHGRLLATGDALVLDEEDLQFRDEEVAGVRRRPAACRPTCSARSVAGRRWPS